MINIATIIEYKLKFFRTNKKGVIEAEIFDVWFPSNSGQDEFHNDLIMSKLSDYDDCYIRNIKVSELRDSKVKETLEEWLKA